MNENLALLRAAMAKADLPALIVGEPANVGWLTGFTGSFARVLVTAGDARFVTDSRYTIQAAEQVPDMPVVWFASPVKADDFVAVQAKEIGIEKLGFEAATTPYSAWDRLRVALGDIELVPAPDLFNDLRLVKSPAEIAKIQAACRLADAAFAAICPRIQPGRTEFDIHLELEFFIRRNGADLAFPPIVVSGERSARPHGVASDKVLEDGDFLTMDFGARLDGYNSDITRTVVVGKATDRHREVYGAVLEAQLAAIAMMRPGVAAKDVDALSREKLAAHGLAEYFGHGLGHGLGIAVHDCGRLAAASEDVLAEGQVWTVEPGIYIAGFGGVRIEDDVVVTSNGVDLLTHSPKDLISLPAGIA